MHAAAAALRGGDEGLQRGDTVLIHDGLRGFHNEFEAQGAVGELEVGFEKIADTFGGGDVGGELDLG